MKKILACLLMVCMMLTTVAASMAEDAARVYALQGPTGIGMVKIMNENDGSYDFTLTSSPDEVVAAILSGNADLAAVPTNLAATLYNKTNGEVRLLGLNTLGVLYIMELGDTIHTVQDLAGKTIYATGQGSTPEYVLNYILEANGLTDSVTVEYKAEHAELATLAAAGTVTLALLPQPHVTSVLNQNKDYRIALDVTTLFGEAAQAKGEDAVLSMGCLIGRKAYVEAHPETVQAFMTAYGESVDFVNADPAAASLLVEQFGIMPKAAVAEKAIPDCHIVWITGEEMRLQIEPFFKVLYDANPKSIGGKMPESDLYLVP